jgi:hypothetical protein
MTTEAKLPRYNLAKALTIKDQLLASLSIFTERLVDAQLIESLVECSQAFLPRRTPGFALHDIFRGYAGQRLSVDDLNQIAWRIAGNATSIADGSSVLPATINTLSSIGWTPVELLRLWPIRRGKHLMCDIRLIALAGSAAGMEIDTCWSYKFVPVVALNVGFTPQYKKRPIMDPTELVGLWFYTKFKPNYVGDGVTIDGVACPSACTQHNREIIDMRRRITPCPQKFTHPCSRCAVGRDRCMAATHRLTYRLAVCALCKKRNPIDDECSTTTCIHCWQGHRTARHG